MSTGRNKGFTLVEVVVSTLLLAVGITALLGALNSMTTARERAFQSEYVQRLAFDKYDELLATGSYANPSLSGDFTDRGEGRYTWRAEVLQTGTTNLESLTVYVDPASGPSTNTVQISGVIYVPPTTGTGTASGAGSGTGARTGASTP